MTDYTFDKKYDIGFTGRENELRWLDDKLFRRESSFTPIVISGLGGVGKTFLIKHWLSSRRITHTPLWLDLYSDFKNPNTIDNLVKYIDEVRLGDRLIVVIDGSEMLTEKEHEEACGKIFNYKAVSSVIFTTRKSVSLRRAEYLPLDSMSEKESADLFKTLLPNNLSELELLNAIIASKGYPLAISLLSRLIKGDNIESIATLLKQPLYELSNNILIHKKDLFASVSPIIISANQSLVTSLQKQPSDLHKLTPREFEKLLADLLDDMGWEVELTKQTRDGGSDILAYMNTDLGRLLCLVEAKHYREDRKIGVDLVRTLYGTLCDAQANSAMLVTSSSFTKDAKEFQQKHQYQLNLRDYADIVTWILKYGNKKNNIAQHSIGKSGG